MPTEREKLLQKQIESRGTQDRLASLAGAQRARATMLERVATQSFSSSISVLTAISWDTVDSDGGGWFDSSTPTQIRPNEAGLYQVFFGMVWASNSSGFRAMALYKNGTTLAYASQIISAGTDPDGKGLFGSPLLMAVGDYFEVRARQSSGGSLNLSGRAPSLHNPYVLVVKV